MLHTYQTLIITPNVIKTCLNNHTFRVFKFLLVLSLIFNLAASIYYMVIAILLI